MNALQERIDNAARQLEQDMKDARYTIETSGSRSGQFGRKQRHESGMYRSNLYLAIRNAVYFE